MLVRHHAAAVCAAFALLLAVAGAARADVAVPGTDCVAVSDADGLQNICTGRPVTRVVVETENGDQRFYTAEGREPLRREQVPVDLTPGHLVTRDGKQVSKVTFADFDGRKVVVDASDGSLPAVLVTLLAAMCSLIVICAIVLI